MFSLSQPTINTLFNTRQEEESILRWTGNNTEYYEFVKSNWQGFSNGLTDYKYWSFWDKILQDGVYELEESEDEITANIDAAAAARRHMRHISGETRQRGANHPAIEM